MALPKSHSWSVATPGLGREPLSCRPVDAGAGVAELGCEPQQDSRGEGLRQTPGFPPGQLTNRPAPDLPPIEPLPGRRTSIVLQLTSPQG